MRISSRRPLLAASILAVCLGILGPDAGACGYSESTEVVTTMHPDLPIDDYVAGHLGLLKPTFARSYLVVAYRTLEGLPLDAVEQAGAREVISGRLHDDVPAVRSGGSAAPAPPDPVKQWLAARATVAPGAPAPIVTTATQRYAAVENCLPAAFTMAAETLADRAVRYGAGSAAVAAWVSAEDTVFENCSGKTARIPTPLASPVDKLAAADRDYQIACAHFYAFDHAEADRRFRRIAADPDSPWRPWGRYLAARNLMRQATSGATPDPKLLAGAEAELRAILADGGLAGTHGAARAYLTYVRAHSDVPAATRDAGVRLATARLGAGFQQAFYDYTWLLDADAAPLEPAASDADRLSAWIGVLKGTTPAAFDRAERLYRITRSPVWLVAALMKATVAHGARLDPLLADAEALAPTSPAFVTASYQRLRLLRDRGAAPGLLAEIARVRAALRPEDGRSTFNEFTALAMRAAPSLDDLLDNAFVVAAGTSLNEGAVTPPKATTPPRAGDPEGALYPEAAELLSRTLPLPLLKRVARSTKLPEAVRASVAATAWARAMLLGEKAVADDLAADVARLNPALAALVERGAKAGTDPERRLAVADLLLQAPALGVDVKPWVRGPARLGPIDTSYGDYWWCARDPAHALARPPAFLGKAERAAAEREQKALAALGAGATFLAREVADLADLLPADPRLPEALHLAVRGTRYGCKDAGTSAASRRAFLTLHRKFPASPWAAETKYYY